VPVPATAGDTTFTQAEAALSAKGFKASKATRPSTTVQKGEVIGTTPPATVKAQYGETIEVIMSTGPPLVSVPDVIGMTVTKAKTAIESVGLDLGNVYGPPGGVVFTQSPAAFTLVTKGSTITLYVR
jgi:serine/threonine-protein kinase